MGFLSMFSWTSMWSLFGLISIITTIWFAGPAIAFADYKPLEPVWSRVVSIVIICLSFLFFYLFKLYKTKKQNERVIEEIKASDLENSKAGKLDNGNRLKDQFDSIDTILQRQENKKKQNIFQKIFTQDTDYIYQKPWFVVIGAPGVGKTSAILNSGLTFPIGTTDHVSKLVGTRDCDWFLSDEALLLDTAGRFVEQNSDVANGNDWEELLGLLKRCRPKQPINGLVLMLSADDIINNQDDKIQNQIQQIRLRLQEIKNSFNTTFPLYVVINKIDLITGFNQYFNYLSDQERKQAFGISLDPLSNTTAEKINKLTDEIELIVDNLQNNIFTSISHNNRNNDSTDLAIGFTNEFEKFSYSLKSYLKKLLNLSKYDAEIQLSGVYFTSAVQSANDEFILSGEDNNIFQRKYSQQSNSGFIGKTKSYFINSIFNSLLINTANIAGVDSNWIKKNKKIYWSLVAALALFVLLIFILQVRAFIFNRDYQKAVTQQLEKVEAESKQVDTYSITSLINFSNKVYFLPKYNINKNLINESFFKNYGLNQYKYIERAAVDKQQSLIDENIYPLISNEISKKLKENIDEKNYNKIYNNLKAYLMLYNGEKYDGDFINQWAVNNILEISNKDKNISKSLGELLKTKKLVPLSKYDQLLVNQARDLLIYTDLASLIMQEIHAETKTLDQKNLPSVSFISMGGPSTNNVFRRVSNQTLNDQINVLYTKYGYENIFIPYINNRLNSIYKEEKWVIGENTNFKSVDDVVSDIYQVYALQYVNSWKSYLNDVKMVQPQNLQQAIVMSKQFSEKNSSLAGIIKGISHNTNLLSKSTVISNQDKESQKNENDNTAKLNSASASLKDSSFKINEAKVQGYLENIYNNFSQYQSLTVSSSDSGSQLDEIIKSINDLYVYLVALELSIQSDDQLMPDIKPLVNYKAQVNRLPDPFRPMLDVFVGKITASSQAYKDEQLAAVVKQQNSQVQSTCQSLTVDKYPFNKAAKQEISVEELSQLFGKQGIYMSTLSSDVMVSSNNKVSFRTLIAQGLLNSNTYLNAEKVNTQYFGGNNTPRVDIVLRIQAMDKNIDNLTISYDGKKSHYFHGPLSNINLTWPAKENTFILEATSADGAPISIQTSGAWSLYRMLDKANKVIPLPDGKSVLAIYDIGGKLVQIEYTALTNSNVFNLVGLKDFKC